MEGRKAASKKNRKRPKRAASEQKPVDNSPKSGIIRRRSKPVKTEEDLRKLSNSPVIDLKSLEGIQAYFKERYGIDVSGFSEKSLMALRGTLAGFDDMLREFPEIVSWIRTIRYNKSLRYYAHIDQKDNVEIGSKGLGDYGTGVHEMRTRWMLLGACFMGTSIPSGQLRKREKASACEETQRHTKILLFYLLEV